MMKSDAYSAYNLTPIIIEDLQKVALLSSYTNMILKEYKLCSYLVNDVWGISLHIIITDRLY